MKRPNILVVGSSNTDMIVRLENIPRPGETLLGGEFAMVSGGKGANQAVAAARAGGEVAFLSRVGNDLLGEKVLPQFQAEGIDTGQILRDPDLPTGVACIFVSAKGENAIGVAPGANAALSPDHVRQAENLFNKADILLVSCEIPRETVEAAIQMAKKHNLLTILNPAPAILFDEAVLRSVDIVTPNESEAEVLTGITVATLEDAQRAADVLHQKGVSTVIITRGSEGAFVSNGEHAFTVPSVPVKAVDTTAAGDVFNGVLAVALGEERSLQDSVRMACLAASISVTLPGAQPSIPTRAEILQERKL